MVDQRSLQARPIDSVIMTMNDAVKGTNVERNQTFHRPCVGVD